MVVDGVNTLDVVVEPYHDEQNLHVRMKKDNLFLQRNVIAYTKHGQ